MQVWSGDHKTISPFRLKFAKLPVHRYVVSDENIMINVDDAEQTLELFKEKLSGVQDMQAWDVLRLYYIGKQGCITEALKQLGKMDPEKRRAVGESLNFMRQTIQDALQVRKNLLEEEQLNLKLLKERIDVTLPVQLPIRGAHHLVTQTRHMIADYFKIHGFIAEEGPDIETETHNFTALNIPDHHPARQSHDTFYMDMKEKGWLLRTHTSTIQVRAMQTKRPPLRILSAGRVYRADFDATHLPMFHQMEGFVIEEGVHLGHLKGILNSFVQHFFADFALETRFRPSFFPFTEPSFEMDIKMQGGKWLEVLGCGMIHPNVLENMHLNPKDYQGFAFGLGLDRFAMLKFNVHDMRHFVAGDLRWLSQNGVASQGAV